MLRALAKQLASHGRRLFEGVVQRGEQGVRANPRNKDFTRLPEQKHPGEAGHARYFLKVDVFGQPGRSSWLFRLRQPSRQILPQELQTKAGDLMVGSLRNSALRLLARSQELATGRKLISMFALVGFSLKNSNRQDIELKEEQYDHLCDEIKCLMNPTGKQEDQTTLEDIRLSDLNIGPLIAKGSNSAVYAASIRASESWIDDKTSEETDSDFSVISESFLDIDEEWQTRSNISAWDIGGETTELSEGNNALDMLADSTMDLAIKMMFNYEIESDSDAIFRAMRNETVPAKLSDVDKRNSFWKRSRESHLEPHPNVVDIKSVFVDEIPTLPDSMVHYPDALPTRLNPEGFGHNKTMFLVMKRYDQTLRGYLRDNKPSLNESLFLFAQLLEAIVHLNKQQVAHRDLKSDNILIDGSNLDLVVSDFGCCLGDKKFRMKIPHSSVYTDKGGNVALMAPEIVCAEPGPGVYLDYSKSDMWTAGTLAYEIFGCENPFYRSSFGRRLDSRTYAMEDLPPLPDFVPLAIRRLIRSILSRDPSQRPDAASAANLVQLFLWAPESWLCAGANLPGKLNVVRWLLLEAAGVMCCRSWVVETSPLLSLKQCFLARISLEELSCGFMAIVEAVN